ncbi:MAG: Ig-like domain-containing protein [Kovacikia sp.]
MLNTLTSFARYLRLTNVLLAIGMLLVVLVLPGRAQTSPVNLAPQGTIITAGPNTGSGGNPSPEVIRDGVKPAVGSTNSQQQYDTFNINNQADAATYLIKADWIGYQFTTPQTFTQVVFQEGIDFDTQGQYDQYYGGWFSGPLQVQVLQGGVWVDVGAVATPAYPGAPDYVSYNTYTLNFPATTGTAIRLYGVPGGGYEFISVGELEVYGYPNTTTAGSSLVKVSGDFQEGVVGTTLSQPLTVQVYNNGAPAQGFPLNFSVTSGGGSLGAFTATTDANGQASMNWQLGQSVYPQPQRVQVSGNGLNTVTFTGRGTGVTRIMPIGDSITRGCCLPSYDGYRRPLWSALNNAGYSVNFVGSLNETYFRLQPTDDYDRDHEGHSGYRTDQVVTPLSAFSPNSTRSSLTPFASTTVAPSPLAGTQTAQVLASVSSWAQNAQPDVALIHLGTNDLKQGVGVSTAITNIGLIIDRLRAVNPNVKILLAKIQYSGANAFNQQIGTLATQKTSANSPVLVVDHTVGWNVNTDTYDTVHPTAAGAQKMANNWLNGIASVLSRVAVTGVSVNPTSGSVAIGATTQLTATVAPANATNKNVTWSSSNTSVATVSASGLVTGVSAGSATITVTTQDGGFTATSAITVTAAASGGSLTGTGASSSATVNLTTDGTTDWAHWSGYDHKASGGSQISNYTVIGSGTVNTYTNDLRTLTWSDGTPTASGSNKNGIYIAGTNNGFQITAPADSTQRTLKVYVGGWNSGGTLTAQLSDGSAANYVNTANSSTGQYNAVYTLTYKAASALQTISVRWVQASGTGNVTLQAATMQ